MPKAPLFVRLHALLTRLLAPRVARRHGPQIQRTFADMYADARATGSIATLLLLVREFTQLLRHGLADMWASLGRGLMGDVRFATRMLRKRPLAAGIMVATMALGIAANVTVFRVVHQVLLQPLPLRDANQLVALWEMDNERGRNAFGLSAPANYRDWESGSRLLESTTATRNGTLSLTGLERPQSPLTGFVLPNFFSFLGVEPILGRTFLPGDEIPGASPVVVLSHEIWEELGGDPLIVGSALELDRRDYTVIGVMPRGYRRPLGGNPARLWVPLQIDDWSNRTERRLFVYGRLAVDQTPDALRHEMATIAAGLEELYPDTNGDRGVRVDRMHDLAVGGSRASLWLLMGAVGFVLLIACVNVANLQLAQGLGRSDEVALRLAVGASRVRIFRQLIVEGLLLASIGAGLGLVLTLWTSPLVARFVPAGIDTAFYASGTMNPWVLAFTVALTFATAVLFGCAPAYRALRVSAGVALGGSRTTDGVRHRRMRRGLAAAEIAISLVLLAGTAVTLQSLTALRAIDPGLDEEGVITMRTGVRGPNYADPASQAAFFSEIVGRIESMPEVVAATAGDRMPPFGQGGVTPFEIADAAPVAAGAEPRAPVYAVVPGYFATLGIPLLDGERFARRAWSDAEPVVILSQTTVARYWGGDSPIGDSVILRGAPEPSYRVIGVVGDVRVNSMPPEPLPVMYLPHEQRPGNTMTLAIRTNSNNDGLLGRVLDQILSVEETAPIYNIGTMDERMDSANGAVASTVELLGWFAALALVMVAVGIHGVMSQSVAERFQEFGIRRALGARSVDLTRDVLGEGVRIVAWGAPLGLVGAYSLSRLLAGLIFAVEPGNPTIYVVVAAIISGVVLLGAWLPSRRALRADPAQTLRE